MRIPEEILFEKFNRELPVEIGAGIKTLLETKHLYQNLELNPKIISDVAAALKGTNQRLQSIAQNILKLRQDFGDFLHTLV